MNGVNTANGINGSNGTGINGMNKSHVPNNTEKAYGVKSSTVTQAWIYRREPQTLQRAIERKYERLGITTQFMALQDVLSLLERDARTIMLAELESPLLARMTGAEMAALQRYTQLACTAMWMTNGVVIQGREAENSLIFGLAKAVMTEQPWFHVCSLDMKSEESSEGALLVLDTECTFHGDPLAEKVAEMDAELVEKEGFVYMSCYRVAFRTTMGGVPQCKESLTLRFDRVGKINSFYFEAQDLRSLVVGEVLVDVDATPLHALISGHLMI
ncbi:Thiolase-like protein [Stemphylium lycopersici]|uniref:Thiolase-like protein n=1 Tax=Stemphylium lycopersici TaxID=183478 RepID=A0A364MWL4_STELY|nr:Thiolase-like protein [Stemphylium lycopersici]RAR05719.1 Thiolase-like protein [Stemphylium lycopersici]